MLALSDKTALVTGASKGIGAAIAKALAEAGATVVVNYATSQAGAEKTVAEIRAAGGRAHAIQGNFSKPDEINRVFVEIECKFRTLDILVNNAGVYKIGPLEDVTPAEFHRQFDLNVLGLLLSTQAAVRLFGPGGGSIINIGSTVGKMAPANSAIYAATKGAVDSVTVTLSKELGARKIRVNSLNPGLVETEGTVTGGFLGESDFQNFVVGTTPLGRIGQPDDIANVAVFLASDAAGWVTGQQIVLAGGQTM